MSFFEAVVDRFEGDKAILLFSEDIKVEFPKEILPSCSEGDILKFRIKVSKAKTKETKKEIEKLIEKLKKQK